MLTEASGVGKTEIRTVLAKQAFPSVVSYLLIDACHARRHRLAR